MDRNPVKTAKRAAQHRGRLDPRAACVLCGEADLIPLNPARRRVLEEHHVLGRSNSPDLTVPLCRNCHAKVTEYQRQGEAFAPSHGNPLERSLGALRSLEAFLRAALDAVTRWCESIETFIRFLDSTHPSWRDDWKWWR